ncbi:transcription factor bHLH110 isoform X2 [Euphorbia lathyris]|uniref:transcription factor bHLH110 isoform X2 n=1 Tax=Euphorbia lathyris TaxID=212925 RepID=UPI003313BDEE
MESPNLHHLQTSSSSSSSSSLTTPPSSFATSASTWTPNYTLNSNNNTGGLNPRQKHEISNPHFNNLMIQDLGFHWNSIIPNHDGKIKEELSSSSDCFPKFSEMLNTNEDSTNDDQQKYMNDLSEKLLLKTISSGFPINATHFSPYNNYGRIGNFSQIYPSINISNLNRSPPPPPTTISPAAFDMNLQALDLLTSTRFSGSFEQPFHDYLGNVMQQHSAHFPSCNPNKVRKEKLGDRIAALQQLVAPFGKTDTASVLMEAIGYIKFLQNQVETLSVPYMKSSRNKSSRTTQTFQVEEGNEERKKDLRSRGLCLVPLSCMSYVTGDGGGGSGGGIWPPPNFGGGT